MADEIPPDSTITIVEEEENYKVCADCSHVLGVRYRTDEAANKWRCGHTNNVFHHEDKQGWSVDRVSGLKHRLFKISEDITVIRLHHCKGDWYEKYVPPVREPTIGGFEAKDLTETVFDAEAIKKNREAAAKVIEEKRKAKLGISGIKASDL